MIVGDVNQTKLTKYIADLEKQEGKELRFTVMPYKEFQYRLQVNDRFLSLILSSKKQVIVDKHGLYTATPATEEKEVSTKSGKKKEK